MAGAGVKYGEVGAVAGLLEFATSIRTLPQRGSSGLEKDAAQEGSVEWGTSETKQKWKHTHMYKSQFLSPVSSNHFKTSF